MEAREVIMSYINALDHQDYDAAQKLIDENVKIIGPAGESFGGPKGFISMMKNFPGRYSVKKIFVDKDEVCLLYDFVIKESPVYMSSWYRVKDQKIIFIRTIFDPAAFEQPADKD